VAKKIYKKKQYRYRIRTGDPAFVTQALATRVLCCSCWLVRGIGEYVHRVNVQKVLFVCSLSVSADVITGYHYNVLCFLLTPQSLSLPGALCVQLYSKLCSITLSSCLWGPRASKLGKQNLTSKLQQIPKGLYRRPVATHSRPVQHHQCLPL